MSADRIGDLFPLGGPVPWERVIGRADPIDELVTRASQGLHTMVVGPRRIGKTTVCLAVCEQLRQTDQLIIEIDVPERTNSAALLQQIVDQTNRISLANTARRLLGTARPAIGEFLKGKGIPLDLSGWAGEPDALPKRTILSLPAQLAEQTSKRIVLFLDELQRSVDYSDADDVLSDLVDLYSGNGDIVVLVDGSDERALSGMLGAPIHFGKLCDRYDLAPVIAAQYWRPALIARFAEAQIALSEEHCNRIIAFGEEHPYRTMAAARFTALAVRKTSSDSVTDFDVEMGLDAARKHLEADGV